MRNRRASRWGLRWAGLLVAVAMAPAAPVAPLVPAADTEAIRATSQAKIKAANEILAMCREFLIAPPGERGAPPPLEVAEQIQLWSRVLTDAKLEAATTHDERIQVLTEAFDRAKGYESEIKDLVGNEASGLNKITASKATYYRVDAEGRLLREKELKN